MINIITICSKGDLLSKSMEFSNKYTLESQEGIYHGYCGGLWSVIALGGEGLHGNEDNI